MQELDATTFDAAISGGTVVVDFWAPWCRPCHAIEPFLEEIAESAAGRVSFVKLNIDEHPEIAARYEVLSIPTVTLFKDGEPRTTVIGARPRAHFERAFAEWL
jgi:thioredoxin 1